MTARPFHCSWLAVAALAQIHGAAAQNASPPYPRLGGYLISSPFNYDDPQYQAQIARLNLAILNTYPGWTGSNGSTMQQAVQAIRALNPSIIVTMYTNIMENYTAPDSAYSAVYQQLNSNTWWLYLSGTGGSPVDTASGIAAINITLYTPANSAGQRYVDWRAAWNVQTIIHPTPALDGLYTDNVFWAPRNAGDYNRDGATDDVSSPTVQTWWRQGYAQYFKDLRAAMPGKYQLGNIADWGQTAATFPELQEVLQGGVMEGIVGARWSYETQGWQTMMTAYRKMMAAIASPQLVIFEQYGSPSDYQSMRYGLASCLMDNAYYDFVNGTYLHGVVWFDEYNASLGPATSDPAMTPYQNGVYRRDFQNGIALVNPKGNGPQTVTLETTYRHLTGSQVPSINNGQNVSSVTLRDRDGLLLLRSTPQRVPAAATLSVQ